VPWILEGNELGKGDRTEERRIDDLLALVAIVFPPRLPSLYISTDPSPKTGRKQGTYSVVMTTLQSQSLTLSLRDSALNPAKTALWTAPIRAQARKAAVACHVMGRLFVSSISFLVIFPPSYPFETSP